MTTNKLVINHAVVAEILTGRAMRARLLKESLPIAQRAGGLPDITIDVRAGRKRARSTIRTATDKARADEKTNGSFSQALPGR